MPSSKELPTVACLVPARNEAGYLKELVGLIVSLNLISEIIICEGGSTDNTWDIALELQQSNPALITSIK